MKTLTSSNYPTVQCWNFTHVFYLPVSTKGCESFFLFCIDLELFPKIKNTWFLHNWGFFTFLLITQNLNKNPGHTFLEISKYKTWAKFQQKILNSVVVGAHQSFGIFRQNTWFLEINITLSIFLYGILHYLISIIKL